MDDQEYTLLQEDEFLEKYKPIQNHMVEDAPFDGCMYETYGEELEFIREVSQESHSVWTILENDNGDFFYSSGYHFVNRYGYLVTEIAWEHDNIEVELENDTYD
jgi:hypothetical protein